MWKIPPKRELILKIYSKKNIAPYIKEVRGYGLMIGLEFKEPTAKKVSAALLEKGFLVGTVGDSTLRIVPPLIISKKDADEFTNALHKILTEDK